jgi:hypothetical protein
MSKFQETIREARTRFEAQAKSVEQDARKFAETLQDRAQAELKSLLEVARTGSREQMFAVGVELEKWGKKLQAASAVVPATDKPAEQVQ